jgi:hypothetical protein
MFVACIYNVKLRLLCIYICCGSLEYNCDFFYIFIALLGGMLSVLCLSNYTIISILLRIGIVCSVVLQ